MRSCIKIGWKAALVGAVATIAVAAPAGWNAAPAQMKSGSEENALAGTTKEALFVPARGSAEADGWALFAHGKVNLKVGAPAPAVPLQGAERDQWAKDIATFKFDELKDRRVLYVYYLSSMTAEMSKALFKAVKDAASPAAKSGVPWAAVGVQYDTAGLKTLGSKIAAVSPDLYRWATVPVQWNEASYKFIESEHELATFAALVKATATALPKGAYDNFGAVEKWSALAKSFKRQAGQECEGAPGIQGALERAVPLVRSEAGRVVHRARPEARHRRGRAGAHPHQQNGLVGDRKIAAGPLGARKPRIMPPDG